MKLFENNQHYFDMKKIIDYLKGLIRKFFPRPKLAEEYIINTSYMDNKDVAEFIKKRSHWCKEEGIEFILYCSPLRNKKLCGEVQLYLNGEKMGSSKLYLDKGKVYIKFNE